MTIHNLATRAAILALAIVLAACTDNGLTEPGESGTRWNPGETATDSRRGVDLTISYNSTTRRFDGSVTNTNASAVAEVRVEIHLSNGTELGPTPRVNLEANETKAVTLDASGQNFNWYSVHVELGSSSS